MAEKVMVNEIPDEISKPRDRSDSLTTRRNETLVDIDASTIQSCAACAKISD